METSFLSRKKPFATIAAMLIFILAFSYTYVNFQHIDAGAAEAQVVRTAALQSAVDYQAVLDGFDDANLEFSNHAAIFSATARLDAGLFEGIDLTSSSGDTETYTVRFSVAYDYEDELVWLSAVADTPEGEIVLDNVCGKVFFDGSGEADAVFDLDGELTLLSELADLGILDEVGLFSKIAQAAKAAVNTVVAVTQTVVQAVVVVVQTVATAAVAIVKSISEQITDFVGGVIDKVTGGSLPAWDVALAFSVLKLSAIPGYTIDMNALIKAEEVFTKIINYPQATDEIKKAWSDSKVPILYRIVTVVVKIGLLEFVADIGSSSILDSVGLVIAARNYAYNSELDETKYLNAQGLIYKQGNYWEWKAGVGDIGRNGCGYVAAYNYLKLSGKYMRLADVIFEFDINSTAVALSYFGINPYEYPVFFKAHGIAYERYDSVEALQAAANAKGDCRILLSYVWASPSLDTNMDTMETGEFLNYLFSSDAVNAHFVIVDKNGNEHALYNTRYGIEKHNSISDYFESDYTYDVLIVGFILP
jgi:hypothetical protein